MRIVELEQGSPQWLSWRKRGVTATEIVAIMGKCPFKSEKDVFQEKMGYGTPIFESEAMKLGKELEPVIRDNLKRLGFDTVPLCVEDDVQPLFKASLDAYDAKQEVLFEIKVSDRTYESLTKGIIPENYNLQCQWQYYIVGPKLMFIVAYSPSKQTSIMHPITPNPDLWKEMTSKAHAFWEMVEAECYIDSRYSPIIDQKLTTLFKAYEEAKQMEEFWAMKKKAALAMIVENSNEQEIECGGYKLSRTVRIGTVDYDAIPELETIDLNQYRKPSTSFWTIRKGS